MVLPVLIAAAEFLGARAAITAATAAVARYGPAAANFVQTNAGKLGAYTGGILTSLGVTAGYDQFVRRPREEADKQERMAAENAREQRTTAREDARDARTAAHNEDMRRLAERQAEAAELATVQNRERIGRDQAHQSDMQNGFRQVGRQVDRVDAGVARANQQLARIQVATPASAPVLAIP